MSSINGQHTPNDSTATERIDIRPGVSILSVLRHLNYQPWYALAEFVDNALQSYLDLRHKLAQTDGSDHTLRVSIDVDRAEKRITIRDNAGGIHEDDYERAFRPAEIPPDRTGLSEFGMGMKSAACWFAPRWSVRTSALGEPVERTISFDVNQIVEDSLEELEVQAQPVPSDQHFTEIILRDVHKLPRGRTIAKIKEHLSDIYRFYTRKGMLELRFNGEALEYDPPDILEAPYHKDPSMEAVQWRKEIDFDFGGGLRAKGFAAIRETGSTSKAGFSLFRRNRVIEGSGDEGYRPQYIFGRSNSYTYQRLFGEIHLEGFEVSHTKDGFQWGENEEPFLELLKEQLNADPLPLIDQSEGYRKRSNSSTLKPKAQRVVDRTTTSIVRDVPSAMDGHDPTPSADLLPEHLPAVELLADREIEVRYRDHCWRVTVEMHNDPAVGDWLEISDRSLLSENGEQVREVKIRLSLAHPFMVQFIGSSEKRLEPVLRVATALALAEEDAYDAGVSQASTIRRNVNHLLREALHRE